MNISYRKTGGIHCLKIGRFTFMWAVAQRYKPIKGTAAYDTEFRPAR